MTLFWVLIWLVVGLFNDFNLPDLEQWNGWAISLIILAAWDISSGD